MFRTLTKLFRLNIRRFCAERNVAPSMTLRRLHHRFAASTRGVAAIEFAMIAPVLATIFLATFDGGRAIAIYMKVRAATYSLGAIANQYQTIASTDMTNIIQVTSAVLAPYSTTPASFTVSQIAVTAANKASVAWSYTQGGTALTKGATITVPTNLATCSSYPCYLIYSQVGYSYTPLFGLFTTAAIHLADNLYMTPRSSKCVVYTPQTGTAC
jgi:Flp pilus assembly protein TadG